MKRFLVWTAVAVIALGALGVGAYAETASKMAPAPAVDEAKSNATSEVAVVAGGCFWGIQGVFQHVDGVTSAVSGYAGGAQSTAQYEKVGNGWTGHAESVQITFDPRKISYGKILQIFFSVHNPTELNMQGPDEGTQYRTAIFPRSAEQAKVAVAYIDQLDKAKTYGAPVVTTIEMNKQFFAAEGYHQDYLTLHPSQPYIVINDLPKIVALQTFFSGQYRSQPVLVGQGKKS